MPTAILELVPAAKPRESGVRAVKTLLSGDITRFIGLLMSSIGLGRAIPLLALGVLAASLAAASAASAAETYYAIGRRVCPVPKHAGEARCFAMRRVVVPIRTRGALPFHLELRPARLRRAAP